MLFRYLPDGWIGAARTAILLLIDKFMLGLYLACGAAGSAYGAGNTLITLR